MVSDLKLKKPKELYLGKYFVYKHNGNDFYAHCYEVSDSDICYCNDFVIMKNEMKIYKYSELPIECLQNGKEITEKEFSDKLIEFKNIVANYVM